MDWGLDCAIRMVGRGCCVVLIMRFDIISVRDIPIRRNEPFIDSDEIRYLGQNPYAAQTNCITVFFEIRIFLTSKLLAI